MKRTVKIASVLGCLMVATTSGCARHRGEFQPVRFNAPSQPVPDVQPILVDVKRLGVLCTTDIEPLAELDIEHVITRLGHAVATRADEAGLKGVTIVSQDDILWSVGQVRMDSAQVVTPGYREALIDSLALDALIVIELERLQTRTTPVSPGPYGGMTQNPGLDLAVDLRMSLINLHTGKIWQQTGQEREWTPVRVQMGGGRSQSEQQLLAAVARPVQRFLSQVTPPPSTQTRAFDLGGR